MIRCVCRNCNYRFESEKPRECPYCGMDEIEQEKSANELLKEVEDLLR